MELTSTNEKTGGKMKVLIVEDDKFLQKVLVTKFMADGFEVRAAADGEEALRQMLPDAPALVVLDLIMPKLNGFEVLSEMRTNPQMKDIPVVVLSNLGQDEDVDRAKQLGAIEFLVKSNLSIQEVVQKIKEAYARHLGAGR